MSHYPPPEASLKPRSWKPQDTALRVYRHSRMPQYNPRLILTAGPYFVNARPHSSSGLAEERNKTSRIWSAQFCMNLAEASITRRASAKAFLLEHWFVTCCSRFRNTPGLSRIPRCSHTTEDRCKAWACLDSTSSQNVHMCCHRAATAKHVSAPK